MMTSYHARKLFVFARLWKSFALSLLVLIFFSNAQASILSAAEYAFPYRDPLLATVLSAINRATCPYETIYLTLHPERTNIAGLPQNPHVPMALFAQKDKVAPLVFVIAGSGGDAKSGNAMLIASQLAALGYHAVTLPNPLSQSYLLGVSQTGLPGYLPRDAHEYYNYLEQVVGSLQNDSHLRISSFSVIGFSYGALLAGFLNQEDHRRQVFRFSKTVMINPALDVEYGIQILDWYYSTGDSIYPQDKFNIFQKIHELIEALRGRLPDTESTEAKYTEQQVERLALDNTQLQWMIGSSFRDALQEIIFTNQQINRGTMLHALTVDQRKKEARRFSFSDYLRKFVAPGLGISERPAAMAAFWKAANFYALAPGLKADRGAYVMESQDDFLTQPQDFSFLNRTFGKRLFLYPYGGHTGNLRFKRNRDDLAAIMAAP